MNSLKKIHKWASVIVGLQMLVWLGSGLYFNLVDRATAKGKTYYAPVVHNSDVAYQQLIEPALIVDKFPASMSLRLIHLLDKPYYLLQHQATLYSHAKNTFTLVDATSAEAVSIDAEFASALALQSYTGIEEPSSVTLLLPPIADFPKQKNALWQVNFANNINTSVYINAQSGQLVGHSDDEKRLADFFYMLHFMDYGKLGGFNSVQVMVFAFIALWLSFSGVYWSYHLLCRGGYRL